MSQDMRLRCPRCGYEWVYRGRKPRQYVTCPSCRYAFKIQQSSSMVSKGGFLFGVVKASEYENVKNVIIKCVEKVGGKWIETKVGIEADTPDDKAEEYIKCLEESGVIEVKDLRKK